MADLFFKFRGWLLAPFGIFLLAMGKPSPASFAAGLVLAVVGESVRIWGVGYAGKTTRHSALEAPGLVTAGPFAHVRNPLYFGNALMGLGGTIMAAGRLSGPAAGLFFLVFALFYGFVYAVVISAEEKFLEAEFGREYARYRGKVRRVIPSLRPYDRPRGKFLWSSVREAEWHTVIPFLLMAAILGLKIR